MFAEKNVRVMLASWQTETPFISPLQATTHKTSTTQQKCFCPTHQDGGEFHTSVAVTAGELEHIRQSELEEQ